MPFDAGGTFTRSYNWQADRDAGIKILAQRMDGEFNNYAGGLNQTFLRTGIVPMGGPLNMNSNPIVGVASGTLINPGFRFESDTDTGIMSSGPGNMTLVVDGVARLTANAGGVTINGSLVTNSGASAGIIVKNDATMGGISLVSGNTANTGYVAFLKPDSSRMGYIGFQPIAGGPVSYMNDGGGGHLFDGGGLSTTGGILVGAASQITGGLTIYGGNLVVAAGLVSASAGLQIDPTFYAILNAGRPMINFDTNDYLLYDRATNGYTFAIGAVSKFGVTPTGTFVIDSLTVGDGLHMLNGGGGSPYWQWDNGDWMQFVRSTNEMTININSVNRVSLTPALMYVNTNLTVANAVNGQTVGAGGAGIGSVLLNSGGTVNTGYTAYHNKDGTRVGYMGFASNASSTLEYVNDVNAGHHFAGGTVTVDGNIVSGNQIFSNGGIFPKLGDVDFVIYKSGNTAIFNVAAGSNFYFDRDAGLFNVVISNAGRFSVTVNGPYAFDTNRYNQLGFRDLFLRQVTAATNIADGDRGRGLILLGGAAGVNIVDLGVNSIVTIINASGVTQGLFQSGTTIVWSVNGATGNRNLAPWGQATIINTGGGGCVISGSGLS